MSMGTMEEMPRSGMPTNKSVSISQKFKALSPLSAAADPLHVLRLDRLDAALDPHDPLLHALERRVKTQIVLRAGLAQHAHLLAKRIQLRVHAALSLAASLHLKLQHLAPMVGPERKERYRQ